MVVALVDASVLSSAPVRDTLLRAAEVGLFQPRWSQQIIDEFTSSLQRHRGDLEPERISRLASRLNHAFPDALISGFERLVPSMTNHPGDRHVLAAAAHGCADLLVTRNIAHFSSEACEPYDITALTPDAFLVSLLDRDQKVIRKILAEQASDLTQPPVTLPQLLDLLGKSVPEFVSKVTSSLLYLSLYDPL